MSEDEITNNRKQWLRPLYDETIEKTGHLLLIVSILTIGYVKLGLTIKLEDVSGFKINVQTPEIIDAILLFTTYYFFWRFSILTSMHMLRLTIDRPKQRAYTSENIDKLEVVCYILSFIHVIIEIIFPIAAGCYAINILPHPADVINSLK